MADDKEHSSKDSSIKDIVLQSLKENPPTSKEEEPSEMETPKDKVMESEATSIKGSETEDTQEIAGDLKDKTRANRKNTTVTKDYINQRQSTRKKEDRLVGRIVLIVVATLIVIGGILVYSIYSYIKTSLEPFDASNSEVTQIEVPIGTSNKGIGEILENEKVIKSGLVFNYYTKFNNFTDFQSGYYQMAPNMTLDEIAKMLEDGGTAEPVEVADAKIIIPEGFTVDQIAGRIADLTEFSADDFMELMTDEQYFQELLKEYPELLTSVSESEGVKYPLEGYLFPATYDYYKEMSLKDIVNQMVAKANNVLAFYFENIQEMGYTVNELLTVASLVEKEGVKDADRKKIAQVFYNRLEVDMPIQSDISVLYALGEHKELVTYKDLEVDSPYNLYLNTGLGPGPFNNPSEDAIKAALNPTENEYYYFVADIKTGKVYFSETFAEHEELVAKYVNQ